VVRVKVLIFLLLAPLGLLAAQTLCLLPFWLFLARERRMSEQDLRQGFPDKAWVAKVLPGLAFLWFLVGGILVFTTDTRREINWFCLPFVIFMLYYLPVGVFELAARVSVLMPFGKVAPSGPAVFIVTPKAWPIGILRLLISTALFVAFLVLQ
jgi:hypothetical protein